MLSERPSDLALEALIILYIDKQCTATENKCPPPPKLMRDTSSQHRHPSCITPIFKMLAVHPTGAAALQAATEADKYSCLPCSEDLRLGLRLFVHVGEVALATADTHKSQRNVLMSKIGSCALLTASN